ncbi:MAG: protein kinase [Propionibacteriaceae bacterium]|jgi:hypothetical protein|nr:protein kinase [Propionibacteriaceae bacterium]
MTQTVVIQTAGAPPVGPRPYVDTKTEPTEGLVPHGAQTTTLSLADPGTADRRDNRLPPEWACDYDLIQVLSESTQAAVYLCRQRADGAKVVLRQSPAYIHHHPNQINQQELGELRHPNLVRSLQPVQVDRYWWWEVIEYCERGSLAQQQAAEGWTGWPADRIEAVVAATAEALHYLHADRNLLHTDIKPDNILRRGDGSFVLADFGSAVSRLDPPSLRTAGGRTIQFSPGDDEFSPAWDWAQVGLTVLSLATGEKNPAAHYREIDFQGLDPRLSLLIRGLLVPRLSPDDRRWGYTEIGRWLAGEEPLVQGHDIGAEAPQAQGGLNLYFDGQTCHSPKELGALMASDWPEARRTIQGVREGRPYLRWLADQLGAVGDSRWRPVLMVARWKIGPEVHPDYALTQLITLLDPEWVPCYPLVSNRDRPEMVRLTREDLSRLAFDATQDDATHQGSKETLRKIFSLGILTAASQSQNSSWLRALDRDWNAAFQALGQRLGLAAQGAQQVRNDYQARLRQTKRGPDATFRLQRGDWEAVATGGASDMICRAQAHLLRALLDSAHADQIHHRADEARQSTAMDQDWFAALAGAPRGRYPGQAALDAAPPVAGRPRAFWRRGARRQPREGRQGGGTTLRGGQP